MSEFTDAIIGTLIGDAIVIVIMALLAFGSFGPYGINFRA